MLYSNSEGLTHTWDYLGQPTEEYSQEFLDLDYDGSKDRVSDDQLLTADQIRTFLMIPQEFSDEAAIVFFLEIDGVEISPVTILLKDLHTDPKWSPGVRYTYKISYTR